MEVETCQFVMFMVRVDCYCFYFALFLRSGKYCDAHSSQLRCMTPGKEDIVFGSQLTIEGEKNKWGPLMY